MTVKLTLDAGALELLFKHLGSDFTLKIRQAALEEVAGRTVHAITTKEVQKAVEEATKNEIAQLVTTRKIEDRPWGHKTIIELKDSFKKLIKSTAQSEITVALDKIFDSDELSDKLQERINSRANFLKGKISEKIAKELNEATKVYIESEVNRRLREISKNIS